MSQLSPLGRTPTDVYDALLRFQALFSFDTEHSRIFATDQFENANSVVDIGCGNGKYVSLLARRHPEKAFIGVDPDAQLLARAEDYVESPNIQFHHGSFDSCHDRFDVGISRLATMYMPNLGEFARWASTHCKRVVLIDNADDLFSYRPDLPIFRARYGQGMVERVASMGGDRSRTAAASSIWSSAGFVIETEFQLPLETNSPASVASMYRLMVLNSELVLGSPLAPDLADELFEWSITPNAHLQYGFHVRQLVLR